MATVREDRTSGFRNQTSLFYDNFADGNMKGWIVFSGSASIVDGKLVASGDTVIRNYSYRAPSPSGYETKSNIGTVTIDTRYVEVDLNDGDELEYVIIVPSGFTWDNGSGDGLWSTAENWSGNVVPSSLDTVIFDETSTANCRLDTSVDVMNFVVHSGYTGTIDGATDDLDHAVSGYVSHAAGTISLGSGTWTVGGSWASSGGTLTEGGDSVYVGGDFTISGTTTNRAASSVWNLTGSGNLSIVNPVTKISQGNGITTTLTGDVNMTNGCSFLTGDNTSTIQDNGSQHLLSCEGISNVINNGATFSATSDGYIVIRYYNGTHNVSGDYGNAEFRLQCASGHGGNQTGDVTCYTIIYTNGSNKWDCNGYNLHLTGSLEVANTGTFYAGEGQVDIDGSLTLSSGTLEAESADILIESSWTNSGATVNEGTSTVTFDGSSTQQVTSGGESFYNLTLANTADTVQLVDALSVSNDLSVTDGTFDLNGFDVSVTGDFTVTNGTSSTFGTLDNRTITAGGNASLSGQPGSFLNLNAASTCILAVTGTLTADYATIAYNNASTSQGTATNSTNGGNNTNWVFS